MLISFPEKSEQTFKPQQGIFCSYKFITTPAQNKDTHESVNHIFFPSLYLWSCSHVTGDQDTKASWGLH